MKSARILGLSVAVLGLLFNEWAFRFIFPLEPIDSFLRLMVLVLDVFLITFVFTFLFKNVTVLERLQTLVKQHPRKLLLFLGSFLAYCGCLSVEFSCRYYFKNIYQAPYTEQTYWEPSAIVRDSILGSSLHKDTVTSHAYIVNDSLIYKQYYRTDKEGRRITPATRPDSVFQQFAMVTGCSFTFGYGLSETETLSYFLDSISGLRGYNYGISGHGTQQTLALLQSRQLKHEIAQPNGVLVHLFIDNHVKRLIGSRRLIKLWAQNYPYYYVEDDALKRDGTFWTGRHVLTRFYRAISQSAFLDLFDIDLPWYISDAHMQLLGAVLQQAQQEFLTQYPNGRFLVVIGPNSTLSARVLAVLQEKDVTVLDLSTLLDKEEPAYKIHWTEGHPNACYYREVAAAIDAFLKD